MIIEKYSSNLQPVLCVSKFRADECFNGTLGNDQNITASAVRPGWTEEALKSAG